MVRSAQETVAQHQDEVEWRSVRIAELVESVETATSALERERERERERETRQTRRRARRAAAARV